jgi:hypothetical protein
MNDTKALDEERLRADEARPLPFCDDCGQDLSEEEIDACEETCYSCQKGKED